MTHTGSDVAVTDGHGFGRLVEFDEASRAYPARALTAGVIREPRSWTWAVGPPAPLDQGREGQCVAYTFTHDLIARPQVVPDVGAADARRWYRRMQELDQFPDTVSGTSILAGVKTMVEAGWYDGYSWCFSEPELAAHVAWQGPVALGINWHAGMRRPDAAGFVEPTGPVVGGHAILAAGISLRDGGHYKLINSWGPDWGLGGWCRIRRSDMARLLSAQGEACAPHRRRAKRP